MLSSVRSVKVMMNRRRSADSKMREFLEKHRREVKNMCLTEFDEERYGKIMHEEGRLQGIIETCEEMKLLVEDTAALISKKLHVSLEDARKMYEDNSK